MPTPYYPRPKSKRASGWDIILGKRNSLLNYLYKKNYSMKMGEVKLPATKLFVPNQSDLARKVMVTEVENFPKHHLMHEVLAPLLGRSIFTTNDEEWREQRMMLSKVFQQGKLNHVYPIMQSAIEDFIHDIDQRVQRAPNDHIIDIDPSITFVTADIIFRTIISSRLSKKEGQRIIDLFERFQKSSPLFMLFHIFKIPKLLRLLPSEWRRIRAGKEIRKIIGRIVHERYIAYQQKNDDDPTSGDDHNDMFHALLIAEKSNGDNFTLDEIVDQVCMLFLAGHETSASGLVWAIYLLALHPEQQQATVYRLKEVLGNREVQIDDLKKLDFVERIFHEALRLYPPVAFFPREARQPCSMRDKSIRAGDSVVLSPWLMQRHEEVWHCPHQFKPERFEDRHSDAIKNNYFPFGMGPRICLGAAFARQEAVLLLSALLQKYRIEMAPNFEPQPVGRLTLRSENGLSVKLIRRENKDE